MNNPNGEGTASLRLDLLCERLIEGVVRNGLEPRMNGIPLWNNGLGDITRECLRVAGVPQGSITVVDLARRVGLLPAGHSE